MQGTLKAPIKVIFVTYFLFIFRAYMRSYGRLRFQAVYWDSLPLADAPEHIADSCGHETSCEPRSNHSYETLVAKNKTPAGRQGGSKASDNRRPPHEKMLNCMSGVFLACLCYFKIVWSNKLVLDPLQQENAS